MKDIRLLGVLAILTCSILGTSKGMDGGDHPEYQDFQIQDKGIGCKCISKGGKTLWDLLMRAPDSFFDDIITFIYHRKKGSVLVVSPSGVIAKVISNPPPHSDEITIAFCDEGFPLDFDQGWTINLFILVAIQRNMPYLVQKIIQANTQGLIAMSDKYSFLECFFWAIVLDRTEIIDLIEAISWSDEILNVLALAAEQAFGYVMRWCGKAAAEELMKDERLKRILGHNPPREIHDFVQYYGQQQPDVAAFIQSTEILPQHTHTGEREHCTIF